MYYSHENNYLIYTYNYICTYMQVKQYNSINLVIKDR